MSAPTRSTFDSGASTTPERPNSLLAASDRVRFQRYTETIRDAVRVRVVRDALGEAQDVRIGEANRAEGFHVGALHRLGRQGELLCVGEDRVPALAEPGFAPASIDALQQSVVLKKSPQTAAMMDRSVVAAVEAADDEGHELAVDLAQAGGAGHGRPVDPQVP